MLKNDQRNALLMFWNKYAQYKPKLLTVQMYFKILYALISASWLFYFSPPAAQTKPPLTPSWKEFSPDCVLCIIISEGLSLSRWDQFCHFPRQAGTNNPARLPAVWWSDWWRVVITRPTLIPPRLSAVDTHPAFVTVWDLNKQWSKALTILGGAASTSI